MGPIVFMLLGTSLRRYITVIRYVRSIGYSIRKLGIFCRAQYSWEKSLLTGISDSFVGYMVRWQGLILWKNNVFNLKYRCSCKAQMLNHNSYVIWNLKYSFSRAENWACARQSFVSCTLKKYFLQTLLKTWRNYFIRHE